MRTTDAIPLPSTVWRRLSCLGIDVAELLRCAGVPDRLRFESRPRVTTKAYFSIWSALERMTGDPAIGVRIASINTTDQLDIASVAAVHAASFAEGLERFARYKRLVCPEVISIEHRADHVAVSFRWLLAQQQAPAALIDACITTIIQLGRYGTGTPIRPLWLDLARPESHRHRLESEFQCPINFEAVVDRLILPSALLGLRFRSSNPDLLSLLLPGLEAQLLAQGAGDAEPDFASRMRGILRAQMQGQRPSVQAAAHAMAMSPRTLQRRLAAIGTSYQSILDEVRHEAAIDLLEQADLEAGEIAFLLGFEEVNSFNRAFAKWTSWSPAKWRRRTGSANTAGHPMP